MTKCTARLCVVLAVPALAMRGSSQRNIANMPRHRAASAVFGFSLPAFERSGS